MIEQLHEEWVLWVETGDVTPPSDGCTRGVAYPGLGGLSSLATTVLPSPEPLRPELGSKGKPCNHELTKECLELTHSHGHINGGLLALHILLKQFTVHKQTQHQLTTPLCPWTTPTQWTYRRNWTAAKESVLGGTSLRQHSSSRVLLAAWAHTEEWMRSSIGKEGRTTHLIVV